MSAQDLPEILGYEVFFKVRGDWEKYPAHFNPMEQGAANRRALELGMIYGESKVTPVTEQTKEGKAPDGQEG